MRLQNKVAIVTGAGRGIGKAIALAFAREGAAVVVVDIDAATAQATAAEITQRDRRATALQVDVSSKRSVEHMVHATMEEYGRIDILVNNAAVVDHYPLLELPEEEWDRILNTNLKGTFLCSQSVAKVMLAAGSGVIINLASIAADLPTPETAHYGASKAAIKQLTKSMAVALGKHNIRVNAIAPGTIRTPMNMAILSQPGIEELKLKIIALDHIGTPEEVADPTVFLASDEARYITGATLFVDGGAILLR
jgi:NAD(P)-dependent dehydrogenase (short-subunit alcohol dehydrogenase family)